MSSAKEIGLFNGVHSVGFFGLGKSNLAVSELLPRDTKITLRTEGRINRSTLPKRLRGARIFAGNAAFDSIDEDILFLSPSVRRDRPELKKARSRGVILSSDLELFLSEFRGIGFAVTGSDGKSTTATMAALLLSEKFEGISAVGNIGIPFCRAIGDPAAALELSSFNLSYSVPRARRAAVTNVTPNHLNWHKDFEEYKNTKLSLLDSSDEVVISADDDIIAEYSRGKSIFATTSLTHSFNDLKGRFNAEIYFTADDRYLYRCGEPLIRISQIKRREPHNLKNLMTAAALADGYVTRDHLIRVAENFQGLAHRCEEIPSSDGVKYINSSIDTTPHRTAQTLNSLSEGIIIILGGRTKGCDFAPLREPLSRKVRLAVVTGECREEIVSAIKGCCDIAVIDGFEDAVLYGASVAKRGDVLLLSPAATSYDEFSSFEERGEKFKEIIKNKNIKTKKQELKNEKDNCDNPYDPA